MSGSLIIRKMLDAIVYAVILAVVCVVGAGSYVYHFAKDLILDNSEISIKMGVQWRETALVVCVSPLAK